MTQYLLSIYQPDGVQPPPEALDPIMREVGAWHQELEAAGAWVFTGRLYPPGTATVLRPQPALPPSPQPVRELIPADQAS